MPAEVTLKSFRDTMTRQEVRRDHVRDDLAEEQSRAARLLQTATDTEAGRDIVCAVMMVTQQTVREYLEGVVSMALATVYGDEYRFELEYEVKRNQSEATPWIVKRGERMSPKDEVGGGVCDICAFALRLALWSLTTPRPAPVFVLDEPGRFLSQDQQGVFGELLKKLSDTLGVQIIMVSHSPDIIGAADQAYRVTQTDGISRADLVPRV